jgi:hypothetical protein
MSKVVEKAANKIPAKVRKQMENVENISSS